MTQCTEPYCQGKGFYTLGKWTAHYTCQKCMGSGIMGNHMFYAGIGSRETPAEICEQMIYLASLLARKGWVLRSGRAKPKVPAKPDTGSADIAFETGCDAVQGQKVIRIASDGNPAALAHAAQFHPAWNACDDYAKALHARNSIIMLGDQVDLPVSFVVTWTPNGAVTGGTGQALRIADAMTIPVYNLFHVEHYNALITWLNG